METIVLLALSLLFPLFLLTDAHAAETDGTWLVEAVVFETKLPDLASGELWKPDDPALTIPGLETAAPSAPAPTGTSPLAASVQRLGTDDHYRILYHGLWRQKAGAKSSTPAMRVRPSGQNPGEQDPRELEGWLRFYLSRHPHIETHLVFRTDDGGLIDAALGRTERHAHFMKEQRRIEPREITYIDHPRFGLLVYASPETAPTGTHAAPSRSSRPRPKP